MKRVASIRCQVLKRVAIFAGRQRCGPAQGGTGRQVEGQNAESAQTPEGHRRSVTEVPVLRNGAFLQLLLKLIF